ncbi:hypothetical protein VTK73DRAFT_5808 [Phialemonium thermophilum]|uniref:Uncharacterized protein n=1 Tax=Phialemonium thermophilum TaxID=223376 RepID=A0ABR3V0P4_9PEZI
MSCTTGDSRTARAPAARPSSRPRRGPRRILGFGRDKGGATRWTGIARVRRTPLLCRWGRVPESRRDCICKKMGRRVEPPRKKLVCAARCSLVADEHEMGLHG